jgi:hypothetical protein
MNIKAYKKDRLLSRTAKIKKATETAITLKAAKFMTFIYKNISLFK